MQFLQDNFFYHSFRNSRLGAERGLEDERQLLFEEQKLCRARARKFSVETNRRRKALEERQKQWDRQEQRLRENVLQQRRQRVQDATERFQRAHLPPSQRRRQSARRNVPNIEDALNQIQCTLSSYNQPSSLLSSTSNICRSCTPSPKPPTVSKYTPCQALSAVEAYKKLVEEQSMTCLNNGQQTEKIQEKHQAPSLQGAVETRGETTNSPVITLAKDSHLSDCCYSESLSSKDSLENEDPNHSSKHLQSSYSSLLLDLEKPNPDQRDQKDLCPASDLTPFSVMTLLGDNAPQSRKLQEPKQQQQDDYDTPNNKMHSSKASWGFTSSEPTPKAERQPTLKNYNLLALSEIMSTGEEHFQLNVTQNSPTDNIIITNRLPPTDTAFKSVCPKEEALLEVKKPMGHDGRQLKHPSATEMILPAKNGSSKNILFEDPDRSNSLNNNNSTTYIATGEETLLRTRKENHSMSSKTEPSASFNNLNKVSNLEPKMEKSVTAVLSNIQSDSVKCLKCPEEGAQNVPVSVRTTHSVRFIKGILKKQSKYLSGDTTCAYGSGNLMFAKQVAVAIRDSVELTQAKNREEERNSTVKKKLRWFDEVHMGKGDNKHYELKQRNYKSSSVSESKNSSEDHQLSLSAVSGASKLGQNTTPPASTGYHFTKQAWADVGVQVGLPQERADEVKVLWSSTKPGGPKVPRKERSARVGAGPVSSRARKGTVIRPQSATEVSQIAKTQGKIMAPHPPPKMQSADEEEQQLYITKGPYGTDHASVNSKHAVRVEQTPSKDNSEGFFLPCTQSVIRTDNTVLYRPVQPLYTCPVSEVNMQSTPSSGDQETRGGSRGRGMMFSEKGIRLDSTPTDEEISQLWFSVRSALSSKDAKALLRRQAPDSGKGVRKPCVEPSRPPPPGSENRKFPQPSQLTKQTAEPVRSFSAVYSVALQDKGLDGAAQLHQGEVHAEGVLEERVNVAATETSKTQRPGAGHQRSQQQGFTISLEEQKILLSLDRLNHQLRCVREHVGTNIGTQGLVLVDAPSTREVKVTNHQRRRASSAHSRTRYQKKF